MASKPKLELRTGGKYRGPAINTQNNAPAMRIRIKILWGVLFLLFGGYIIGIAVNSLVRQDIAVFSVTEGTIASPSVFDGVIIRDEVLYHSENAGAAVYTVVEKEKASKGKIVCYVGDANKISTYEEDILNLTESIIDAKPTGGIFEEDIKKTNADIKSLFNENMFHQSAETVSSARDLRAKADALIKLRNDMFLAETRGDLRRYTTGVEFSEEQINALRESVTISEGGIFSTHSDFLEKDYTLETMESLPKERTLIKPLFTNLASIGDVAQGGELFKIVRSNEWYIAAYIPVRECAEWGTGENITLLVERENTPDNYDTLDVSLYKITRASSNDDERYVVFKCTRYMADYIAQRGIRFKISTDVKKGIKIPSSAIIDKVLLQIPPNCIFHSNENDSTKDMTYAVKKLPDGTEQKVFVSPSKYSDLTDAFVYVMQDYSGLALYDQLVMKDSPDMLFTIASGVPISGVYLMNTGYPEFYRIYFEGARGYSGDDEYVVLDKAENMGIKIMDKIALFAKEID